MPAFYFLFNMDIILENGQVIIDLDDAEFQAFEGMFANLNENHLININGLDWPEGSINDESWGQDIKPIHLCRTIGEACAVESAGPLDIRSLYPFWKYGFCFSEELGLQTAFTEIDPHKKANLSDEFGMGLCAWAMEEIFGATEWCDTADALAAGDVEALGTSRPDFVCNFADGSFGIFEAKGTTTGWGTANSQSKDGKDQTATIEPVSGVVSVRCCTAAALEDDGTTALILRDPPGGGGMKVRLSAEDIRRGARRRRFREGLLGDIRALFRGERGELTLRRRPWIPDKRHGWLDVE